MNRYEAASEAVRTPKTPSLLWEPRLRIPPNLKGQTVIHRWERDGEVVAEVPFEVGPL